MTDTRRLARQQLACPICGQMLDDTHRTTKAELYGQECRAEFGCPCGAQIALIARRGGTDGPSACS